MDNRSTDDCPSPGCNDATDDANNMDVVETMMIAAHRVAADYFHKFGPRGFTLISNKGVKTGVVQDVLTQLQPSQCEMLERDMKADMGKFLWFGQSDTAGTLNVFKVETAKCLETLQKTQC